MKYIVGNFKMNGDSSMMIDWIQKFSCNSKNKIIIAPPQPYLNFIDKLPNNVFMAAQDVSPYQDGAYTGQVSAKMLYDLKVSYCIIGHSERREYVKETDDQIYQKFCQLNECSITPIICVGESQEIREKNTHENFVVNQLEKYTDINEELIFAYEPIWAIGTGKIPTISDIGQMINVIKDNVSSNAKVLYGGSVNAKNASNLLAIDNLDGLLVGGASLNPVEFANIAQS